MLEYLKQKKNLVIIVCIIIIIAIYFFYNMYTESGDINLETNMLEVAENTTDKSTEDDDIEIIVVHITGAVKNPGIVKLEEGSRIEDAIEAAGGLTEESNIENVNLAYLLDDGVKIRIPFIDDETSDEDEDYITEDSGAEIDDDNSSSTSLININKATQTELETLPGIGPSLASKIIAYREDNGKFSAIEDIKNVSGIGDSKYSNIKDLITV